MNINMAHRALPSNISLYTPVELNQQVTQSGFFVS